MVNPVTKALYAQKDIPLQKKLHKNGIFAYLLTEYAEAF